MATEPGWYDDPADPTSQRYWDGTAWTNNTSPKSPAAAPPPAGPSTPPPPPVPPMSPPPPYGAPVTPGPTSPPPGYGAPVPPYAGTPTRSMLPFVLGGVALVVLIGIAALALTLLGGGSDATDTATDTVATTPTTFATSDVDTDFEPGGGTGTTGGSGGSGGSAARQIENMVDEFVTDEYAGQGITVDITAVTCDNFDPSLDYFTQCEATLTGANQPLVLDVDVSPQGTGAYLNVNTVYNLVIPSRVAGEVAASTGAEVSSCDLGYDFLVMAPGASFECQSNLGVIVITVNADGTPEAKLR